MRAARRLMAFAATWGTTLGPLTVDTITDVQRTRTFIRTVGENGGYVQSEPWFGELWQRSDTEPVRHPPSWWPRTVTMVHGGPSGSRRWLSMLEHHRSVSFVCIGEDGLTSEDLEVLGRLPSLTNLDLDGVQLSGKGAWASLLSSARHLESLSAAETNIDIGGLRALGRLPELEHVNLDKSPHVDDAGLRELSRSKSLLAVFNIGNGDGVTDAGLTHLGRVKTLFYVKIENRDGRISPRGVFRLRSALPNCMVSAWLKGHRVGDPNGNPVD